MAEANEVSKTEIMRRSLSLYRHVSRELEKSDNNKIAIIDEDDNILLEILMTD